MDDRDLSFPRGGQKRLYLLGGVPAGLARARRPGTDGLEQPVGLVGPRLSVIIHRQHSRLTSKATASRWWRSGQVRFVLWGKEGIPNPCCHIGLPSSAVRGRLPLDIGTYIIDIRSNLSSGRLVNRGVGR